MISQLRHIAILILFAVIASFAVYGAEVERYAIGGIRITTDYNDMGLVRSRHVHSGGRHTGWRSYRWDVGARLMSMRCSMRGEPVLFDYDSMCNLVRGDYAMHDSIFRTPDKVGNLYREEECRGREYDRGGRLLWDGEYHFRYDCEGNLVMKTRREVHEGKESPHGRKQEKRGWFTLLFSHDNDNPSKGNDDTDGDPFACWQPGDTCYRWHANGMLSGVRTPDGKTVTFGYDALGRRVSKTVGGSAHRFGWDGNVVLHEWDIEEADRPKLVTDETGREEYAGTERTDNLVTWVYDGTSFTPVAKVTNRERYTIVHDYLGTPTQACDSEGNLVWEMLLDVYGEVMECRGDRSLVPFRYQGQYEDEETGLYYNRFRYYSPQMGMYISSDPIGLAGNNPTLYGYVQDVNTWLDVFGLDCKVVEKASRWQGKGDYPGVDDWKAGKLKKGDVIYGGVPGQSEFYLSKTSIDAAGGLKEKLWRSAQVKKHEVFGYRDKVQAYEVLEDTDVAISIVKANPHLGERGATQIYVDDYKSVLKPIGNPINIS